MRQRRHGLTLVELLVAMSIMLVGIYAVASGFPALFGTIESERVRSEMARRAEARMERLQTTPAQVPDAVVGWNPDPAAAADELLINPDIYPDESVTPVPANPRDDLTWVLREQFRVPMAQAGRAYSVYPLSMGLASGDTSMLGVDRVYPLERVDAGLPMDNVDDYRIAPNGTVTAPDNIEGIALDDVRVDYVWVDVNGVPHGVKGEIVANGGQVTAAAVADPQFANVLAEKTAAEALIPYTTVVGQPSDLAPGYAVLESNFGAVLLLPVEDAGAQMEVSYRLKTEAPVESGVTWQRRVPVMMEEMAAPTDGAQAVDPAESPSNTVDLAFRGIDDQNPLFTQDLLGNAFSDPIFVLVVDIDDGMAWSDLANWIMLDFVEGKLTFEWDPESEYGDADGRPTASEARGRDLRIYYRTIDGHTLAVQKSPVAFVEDVVANALPDPTLVSYRTYQLAPDPTDNTYGQLIFPDSAAGQMVVVDYVLIDETGAIRRTVSGEMHGIGMMHTEQTISAGEEPVPAITLKHPAPQPNGTIGILGVRGVSVTVRGWWHDEGGQVQRVSIDTFLAPEPMP